MRVSPSAKAARHASIGYSSIIDGARSGGTRMPLQRARPDAKIADQLAALVTAVQHLDVGAHVEQGLDEAVAGRVEQHILDHESEPGEISAAPIMKAAELGSPGTAIGAPSKLGVAAHRDGAGARPSILDGKLRAEKTEHALGMVARRQRLDHGGAARRMQAGEQHRGFDLRRGHGKVVDDGQQVAVPRTTSGSVAWSSSASVSKSHRGERRQHAAHRPSPERCIAGKFDLHVVAGDDAEHQPAAGAGIAEIEGCGRREAGLPPLGPSPRPPPLDRSTSAPSAVTAFAVAATSSASSRPVMRVTPVARAPRINARWEIDLSPGTLIRPERRADGLAVKGCFIGSQSGFRGV